MTDLRAHYCLGGFLCAAVLSGWGCSSAVEETLQSSNIVEPSADQQKKIVSGIISGDSSTYRGGKVESFVHYGQKGELIRMGVLISSASMSENEEGTDATEASFKFNLPEVTRDENTIPFVWAELSRNSLPRDYFDVRFYLNDIIEINRMRNGNSMDIVVLGELLGESTDSLPDGYLPEKYTNQGRLWPTGETIFADSALMDPFKKEYQLDHIFTIGTYDGKIVSYGLYISEEYLNSVELARLQLLEVDLPQPTKWQISGFYPTRYAIVHANGNDNFYITLEKFVYREAS